MKITSYDFTELCIIAKACKIRPTAHLRRVNFASLQEQIHFNERFVSNYVFKLMLICWQYLSTYFSSVNYRLAR